LDRKALVAVNRRVNARVASKTLNGRRFVGTGRYGRGTLLAFPVAVRREHGAARPALDVVVAPPTRRVAALGASHMTAEEAMKMMND
jgi:hypothetical protein